MVYPVLHPSKTPFTKMLYWQNKTRYILYWCALGELFLLLYLQTISAPVPRSLSLSLSNRFGLNKPSFDEGLTRQKSSPQHLTLIGLNLRRENSDNVRLRAACRAGSTSLLYIPWTLAAKQMYEREIKVIPILVYTFHTLNFQVITICEWPNLLIQVDHHPSNITYTKNNRYTGRLNSTTTIKRYLGKASSSSKKVTSDSQAMVCSFTPSCVRVLIFIKNCFHSEPLTLNLTNKLDRFSSKFVNTSKTNTTNQILKLFNTYGLLLLSSFSCTLLESIAQQSCVPMPLHWSKHDSGFGPKLGSTPPCTGSRPETTEDMTGRVDGNNGVLCRRRASFFYSNARANQPALC